MSSPEPHYVFTNPPERKVRAAAFPPLTTRQIGLYLSIEGAGDYAGCFVTLEQAEAVRAMLQTAIEEATPPDPVTPPIRQDADGLPATSLWSRKNQRLAIGTSLSPLVVEALDELAEDLTISRSRLIEIAVVQFLLALDLPPEEGSKNRMAEEMRKAVSAGPRTEILIHDGALL